MRCFLLAVYIPPIEEPKSVQAKLRFHRTTKNPALAKQTPGPVFGKEEV